VRLFRSIISISSPGSRRSAGTCGGGPAKGRLLAARPATDLENDVARVGRIAGNEEEAQVLLEARHRVSSSEASPSAIAGLVSGGSAAAISRAPSRSALAFRKARYFSTIGSNSESAL
jgi:hypothetical protein